MKQVVLITGTSTGLGLTMAVRLARRGSVVYATMRNTSKRGPLEKAAKELGVSLHILQLNVEDSASIQRCVDEILEKQGQLDVLINNAGSGYIRTSEQATEAEIEQVMNLNFMGVVRCTKAVLPHMRQKRAGHIVNISSVGGLVGQPFNEIYCAAKFAVEGYTESMANYIQPKFGVSFSLIEPGGIRTEFANSALKHFQESGGLIDDEYKPLFENYIKKAQERSKDAYQSADEVTDVVLQCIDDPHPPIRMRTSRWSENFCSIKTSADKSGKKLQQEIIQNYFKE